MITDNILNTENYTYEPFSHNGFSGSLYLATAKDGSLPRLLIKHENPSSACNEFMYSRLAELLCIHAPKVYLFEVAKKDKKLFASPYVVSIEYIDGLHPFTLDEMNSKPEWQREYAENYALAVMCSQDDNVQMSMTPDGHIVSFDYTECFYLTATATAAMDYDEETRIEIVKRHLSSVERASHGILANAGAEVLRKHLCKEPLDEVYPLYHEPMRRLIGLTTEQIEAATDPLFDIYPAEIGVYFEEYIKMMQAKMKAYLLGVEKRRDTRRKNMKYKLYRSFGNLDRDVKKHELVGVEFGKDIDEVTDALIRAAADDLAGMPEYEHCETAAYAPELIHSSRRVKRYDYEMMGIVYPPNASENILIDFGIVEEEGDE